MKTSNADITKLLREVAAAYTIKKAGNIFQIRAYENAADSIEHLTSEIRDLWEDGQLDSIPGLGQSLKGYLEELFKTGKVKHFESVKKDIPEVVFAFLNVPGVGPKTALELSKLGVISFGDFKEKVKNGKLVELGFSAKIAEKIMQGLEEVSSRSPNKRMLLPYAYAQADKILAYLKKSPDVKEADPLGSLRRRVATIGDLDFSASSKDPKEVIKYFVKMPGISRVISQGEDRATVMLVSGLHVDLLVGKPESYGALLQHFTGGKNHNIKLRNYALTKGLSLNEVGVKNVKTDKIIPIKTEKEFYELLKMDTPEPEIREDIGEIEAALAHKLPNLVEYKDIKGDLHTHSNFPIESPSHGPGADSIEEIIEKAKSLGYSFIGISDHPPGHGKVSKENIIAWVEKRTKFIQELRKSKKSIRIQHTESGSSTHGIQILNGLEIDILPDGSLNVPDEALETLDYCIAGIHSGHRGGHEVITKRILSALNNPHVDIISHPTNRLLGERESSDANWEEIFKVAAKNKKLLEINAYPNRLDLRDDLVRLAKKYGVKFVIDTDAHAVDQMNNMPFGVSVARRGWAQKEDIVNAWSWTEFAKWFNIQ
jgi:DNA polymerase (family X)